MALCSGCPDLALGSLDEVWWSPLAQPTVRAWAQQEPVRLVEKGLGKGDAEREALACYGLFVPQTGKMLLRFVHGRPLSQVTCDFLAWIAEQFATQGKRALFLVWDNARWHTSKIVGQWIKAHNRHVKKGGGCRLVVCSLPSKGPWLNPIAPKWMHGKKAVAEPERVLSASELMERVCAYYQCEPLEPIAQALC